MSNLTSPSSTNNNNGDYGGNLGGKQIQNSKFNIFCAHFIDYSHLNNFFFAAGAYASSAASSVPTLFLVALLLGSILVSL